MKKTAAANKFRRLKGYLKPFPPDENCPSPHYQN